MEPPQTHAHGTRTGGGVAAHLDHGRSHFVNAATWGLAVTGRLASLHGETGLGATLTRLIARAGEPVVCRDADLAMHMLGEPLYEEIVGPAKLDRPCRIYAPVGTHETLLA